MNCKDVQNKLFDYAENKLTASQKQEIDAHLQNCKQCRQKLHILQETLQLIENEKETEINPFIITRINAKIKQKKENKIFSKVLQPVLLPVIIAVAILLGSMTGKYFGNALQNTYAMQTPVYQQDTLIGYAENSMLYDDDYFLMLQ